MLKLVNFLLGVAAGAVVASVVVTLLAPSSGNELRGHVKDYIQNVQDEVQKAREVRRQEMERQLENMRKPAAS